MMQIPDFLVFVLGMGLVALLFWMISQLIQSLGLTKITDEQAKAIRELRAMSDRDLDDLGITRGTIVHAVLSGKEDKQ